MDYYISQNTLDSLEKVVYDINIKLLQEVHKKYLKDLDFEELKLILDGVVKKTYSVEVTDNDSENE
jgi:hypothetical protein